MSHPRRAQSQTPDEPRGDNAGRRLPLCRSVVRCCTSLSVLRRAVLAGYEPGSRTEQPQASQRTIGRISTKTDPKSGISFQYQCIEWQQPPPKSMGAPARAHPGLSVHSPGLRSGAISHPCCSYSHFRTPLFPCAHRYDRLESISVSPIGLGCGPMGARSSHVM